VRLWIIVLACFACQTRSQPESRDPDPKVTVAPLPAKPDPWATSSLDASDDPPSFPERHRLATEKCPKVTHPYLFTIEKDHRTSYLLGTRHIGVSLAKMPELVRERIRGAKLAVFEVAPDDNDRPKFPDIDVREALGEDLWNRYSKLVGHGIADFVRKGRPSTAVLMMVSMYDDVTSMLDSDIEKEVAADHIPAIGLETARFQDNLIDKLMDVRALRAAVSTTKDRAELEHDELKSLATYCDGSDNTPGTDDEARGKMIGAGYTAAEIDALDEELVYARNASWIPKLEHLFEQDDVLIVVGAAHTMGPRGVPALLEKHGYRVTRVEP
jgi:uncharacterized protein YbaP (TraB family)